MANVQIKANAEDIRKALEKLADTRIAAHSQAFFKTGKGEYGEGDRFLGIRVPVIRQQVRTHQGVSLDDLKHLLRSVWHEERLFALLAMVDQFQKAGETLKTRIYRTYLNNTQHINNWDLVDSSAPQIVGVYLQDRDRNKIYRLADSDNLWERRIAVMSTFHFIRLNDFEDLLNLAETLLGDDEDLIHKAVGWMLREVGKRSIQTERRFLDRHYTRMPRTMLRYAIEKMPKPERARYLTR